MTNLIPVGHHILVEAMENPNTTQSGIIISTKEESKPGYGVVIAVGEGKILDNGNRSPMDVNIGDTVYFTKYAPDEVEVETDGTKKKYLVVQMTSVLAKVPAK